MKKAWAWVCSAAFLSGEAFLGTLNTPWQPLGERLDRDRERIRNLVWSRDFPLQTPCEHRRPHAIGAVVAIEGDDAGFENGTIYIVVECVLCRIVSELWAFVDEDEH